MYMMKLEELYNWFYLRSTCANMEISNCQIPLRVAPIKKTNKYENLEIDSNNYAFAEKNSNWNIEYFRGLKKFLLIEQNKFAPIFIFDNHNHALSFWYDTILKQKLKNIELIHIDQHSDCWENKNHLRLNMQKNELKKVFNFCNQKCNVWNFIPTALESWIISKQTQIRSIITLQNLYIDKNTNFILDIDLDFCLDWIKRNKTNQETIKILKNKFNEFWKYATCITIATSPYFLDQQLAINIIQELFK